MQRVGPPPDDFLGLDASMRGPFMASALFHVVLFTLTAVGIPFIAKDHMIVSNPINVEIVTIDKITQTNRVAMPIPKQENIDEPPPEAPEKPQPPQMTEDMPPQPAEPETLKAEDIPLPAPPEVKAEKPKEKPKPAPKKPEATKKQEETKKKDFESLLKNLTPDAKEQVEPQEDVGEGTPESQIAKLSDRLTISEEDALRRQLAGCWNVMSGAKDAEDLVVEIKVIINRDRTVQQATILNQARYTLDNHYRAAADAAMRALRNQKCSPLELPPDKYEEWKTTIIRFDPSEMLN